ncbi:histidine phosphatase family protein [Nigerium massiliense]|uniref:histidine phosphatase family protein n=1 Tax=Nigerium massiliense TaxID=1522317 RepID=UPI0006939946|nr:histidine phosphatase family protein [Nigerium massiliense]
MGARISFVRHGQCTWNESGRVPGQGDPPLTGLGLTQARVAAEALADAGVTRLIASDLLRARQTAAVLGEALGLAPSADPALREQDAGSLTGLVAADLRPEVPPAGVHPNEVRWGGGESVADVHARLSEFFARLRPAPTDHVVLVSHGLAIQVALAVLEGRGAREVRWDTLPNGGVRTVPWLTRQTRGPKARPTREDGTTAGRERTS